MATLEKGEYRIAISIEQVQGTSIVTNIATILIRADREHMDALYSGEPLRIVRTLIERLETLAALADKSMVTEGNFTIIGEDD